MARAQFELQLASAAGLSVLTDLPRSCCPRSCCQPLANTAPFVRRGMPSTGAAVHSNTLLSPVALGLRRDGRDGTSPGPEGAAGSGVRRGRGRAGGCAPGAVPQPRDKDRAGRAPARPRGRHCRGQVGEPGLLPPCPLVPKAGSRSLGPHRPWDTGPGAAQVVEVQSDFG